MKKTSDVLLKIFALGILICLFVGGISVLGYIVALFVGGETATNICLFTFKSFLPWVIKITSIFTGIGLLGMYLKKQQALTVQNENIINENLTDK